MGHHLLQTRLSGNDGAINITVSGGTPTYTYSWTGPGGFSSNSQNINGLVGGLYSVTITDLNGCTTTLTDILVNSFVGLDENIDIQFNVFPNPTNGLFNVALNREFEKEITLSVYDLCGRLIYKTYENREQSYLKLILLTKQMDLIYLRLKLVVNKSKRE